MLSILAQKSVNYGFRYSIRMSRNAGYTILANHVSNRYQSTSPSHKITELRDLVNKLHDNHDYKYGSTCQHKMQELKYLIERLQDKKNVLISQHSKNNYKINILRSFDYKFGILENIIEYLAESEIVAHDELAKSIDALSTDIDIFEKIDSIIGDKSIKDESNDDVILGQTIAYAKLLNNNSAESNRSNIGYITSCFVLASHGIASILTFGLVIIYALNNKLVNSEGYDLFVYWIKPMYPRNRMIKLIWLEGSFLVFCNLFLTLPMMGTLLAAPLCGFMYRMFGVMRWENRLINQSISDPKIFQTNIDVFVKYHSLDIIVKEHPTLLPQVEQYDDDKQAKGNDRLSIKITRQYPELFKYLNKQTIELAEEIVRDDARMIKFTNSDIINQSDLLQKVARFASFDIRKF